MCMCVCECISLSVGVHLSSKFVSINFFHCWGCVFIVEDKYSNFIHGNFEN